MIRAAFSVLLVVAAATAFSGSHLPRQQLQQQHSRTSRLAVSVSGNDDDNHPSASSRRAFLVSSAVAGIALATPTPEDNAEAIGPVKVDLKNPKYTAAPCPKVRKTFLLCLKCLNHGILAPEA